MLRFVPPVVQFRRTVTADALLRGQKIRAGEKVVIYYPSANRDEEVFAAPDRFDLRRSPNPHLAFGGGGAHYCLGANLGDLLAATGDRAGAEHHLARALALEPDLTPARDALSRLRR